MRVLIQRVRNAEVNVSGRKTAEISGGLLLFAGICRDDEIRDVEFLAHKVANLRVFEDDQGKMNLDIKRAGGMVLSVPQFTLCADVRKGNRPGFDWSAHPETARKLWQRFNDLLRSESIEVREGVFGAHMEIGSTNDGPVTIWIDSRQ
jgi:D-tyrosyl-tRNA(Tyr) deacylase